MVVERPALILVSVRNVGREGSFLAVGDLLVDIAGMGLLLGILL